MRVSVSCQSGSSRCRDSGDPGRPCASRHRLPV